MYLKRYGEISSFENGSVDKEEWSKNDLKARVRMAEDQAALLGRKIVKLLHEAEKNIKENEVSLLLTFVFVFYLFPRVSKQQCPLHESFFRNSVSTSGCV